MARPGDELAQTNGVRLRVLRTSDTTGGRALELEWHVPVGERLVALPHRHVGIPERFEIVRGSARHWVGRRRLTAHRGDAWVVSAGTSHVHPGNVGSEPLVVRQSIELDEPDPALVGGVERYFETIFALENDGRVDRFGRIKNPFQDALTLSDTLIPGTYLSGVPIGLQRAVIGLLARIARRRGMTSVR